MIGLASLVPMLPSAAFAGPLKPDVQTLSPPSIRICQEAVTADERDEACRGTGRTVMRITNDVGNVGAGPLELVPLGLAAGGPADCAGNGYPDISGDGIGDDDDMWVEQRIYDDANGNGFFTRGIDTGFTGSIAGCRYWHAAPGHNHYHFPAFARFQLYDHETGELVRNGNKTSFCVADSGDFALSLPGALLPVDGRGYYRGQSCSSTTALNGTSIGWYDRYPWSLAGQELNVTGLPAGDYCLVSQGDPENKLQEVSEANNDYRQKVRINPAQAPVNASNGVQRLSGACPSDAPPPGESHTLRPNADLTGQWSAFGASAAWDALNDDIASPTRPGSTDYIGQPAPGEVTEVGLASPALNGATPQAATLFYYGKTYKTDTQLQTDVRWGGATHGSQTLGTGSGYAWRSISLSPPPADQAAVDDISIRFTALGGTHAVVRAAYVVLDT